MSRAGKNLRKGYRANEKCDVAWRLEGKIATDSLNNNTAYGIGPIEYLKGEILLFEGQTYVSKVIDSLQHKVEQTTSSRAPFFVAHNKWSKRNKYPSRSF